MANNSTKVMVGAGLAGLAAGLLFAPKSGKETRADMKRKANELSDQANQKLEAGKEKASDIKKHAIEQTKKVRSSIVSRAHKDDHTEAASDDLPLSSM